MTERVWESKLDDVWDCRVERTSDYRGQLIVSRIDDPSEEILNEEVYLSYGAQFGPDVSDVGVWQEKCMNAVDGPAE